MPTALDFEERSFVRVQFLTGMFRASLEEGGLAGLALRSSEGAGIENPALLNLGSPPVDQYLLVVCEVFFETSSRARNRPAHVPRVLWAVL